MATTVPLPKVDYIPRDEFLHRDWEYREGEHVTILGPTGSGKTHLAYQLLGVTANQDHPAIVMVMKPRDETAVKFTKKNNFRRVSAWPPPLRPHQRKPHGYTLWPSHTFNPYEDEARQYRVFRHAILDSYKRGNRILFADETYSLTHELNLEKEMITVWTKGRSMGTAIWGASQRPAFVPMWMYDQAEHLFIAYDPDVRAQKRYGEIGGVDPKLIVANVVALRQHEWLYIRRSDRTLAVISA